MGGGTKASAYIELVNECVCELDRAKAKVCSAVHVCVCVCVLCVFSQCASQIAIRLSFQATRGRAGG